MMELFLFIRRTGVGLFLFFLVCAGSVCSPVQAASPADCGSGKIRSGWPPEGRLIRCPVTRDTSISSVGKEQTGSNGGASRIKLKAQQEFILFDADVSPLKGKIVTGALLHLRSASPEKAPLIRVGVSTIASPWGEGFSRWYWPLSGSACFLQAKYKLQDWAFPGSTVMNVVFGYGHTLWKFAECTPPDENDWQTCAIAPDVVSARIAGLSYGFSAYDEVGHTWSIKNGKFQFNLFPNRYCYSRESGKSAPWVDVWVSGSDSVPPDAVKSIHAKTDGIPAGEALVSWPSPEDHDGGKTLGFHVSYKKGNSEIPIPRYLIPMAKEPGREVRMHIQDLPFTPGEKIFLTIKPVDSAGNIGKPFTHEIILSKGSGSITLPPAGLSPFPLSEKLPKIKNVEIFVTDMLDKVQPDTGRMIPPHPAGYKGGNHLFSAANKTVRLHGARNETIGFQLHIKGSARNVRLSYGFDHHPNLTPRLYRFGNVKILDKKGKAVSELPDPLISLSDDSGSWRLPDSDKKYSSLLCELYIPHQETAGVKKGRLKIFVDDEEIELTVALTVWDFTLPDKLSFVPEMNAYGTVSPYKGYEYYRLAHEHRTCINRLPYGWSGQPDFAPAWNGEKFDWDKWDRKVGPILDGTAFAGLPRAGEPVDVFYLPFNENWPVNLFEHYTPSYWADEAFTPRYRQDLMRAFEAFAVHCREKKWHDTVFQFYLNNKIYYRKKYPKNAAPWIFDEPVNIQDFWALRWYGMLWHSAVSPVAGNTKMWYRGDISYSQFGRNLLWGIMDITYLGGNNALKTRMKRDETILWEKSYFAEYGSPNKIEDANFQPVLWALSAWSEGAMGILPWQAIGGKNAWNKADQNALFYPRSEGPVPSIRLKAFMRGQQDVEYLMLLCEVLQKQPSDVGEWLKKNLKLNAKTDKSSESDAGTLHFEKIDVMSLWKFRNRLGTYLSRKSPKYKRNLSNRTLPEKSIKYLPNLGNVCPTPLLESRKPTCDAFSPVNLK